MMTTNRERELEILVKWRASMAFAVAFLLFGVPSAPVASVLPTVGGEAHAQVPGHGCWPSNACPQVFDANPPGDGYGTPAPPAPNDTSLCTIATAAVDAAAITAIRAQGSAKAVAAAALTAAIVARNLAC